MANWYYQAEGAEQGPFAPNDFKRLVGEGRITAQTLVRRDDQAQAVPAGRVNGLVPAAAGAGAATALAAEPAGGLAALDAGSIRAGPGRAGRSDGDPFAPPSEEGDDDRPRRGRGGKRSPMETVWRPLVSRRGWLVFGGIIQLVIGGFYILAGVIGSLGIGRMSPGMGVFQFLVAAAFGGVFILMGLFMLRAGTALGRAGRSDRGEDYKAASRALAGYFTVLGIIFAISVGLMLVAVVFGAVAAVM